MDFAPPLPPLYRIVAILLTAFSFATSSAQPSHNAGQMSPDAFSAAFAQRHQIGFPPHPGAAINLFPVAQPSPPPPPPPPPPFLANATNHTRQLVVEILGDRHLSKYEQNRRIDRLIRGESERVQKSYDKYRRGIEQRRADFELQRRALVANMSAEAQLVDAELAAIVNDESIDAHTKQTNLEHIIVGVPDKIRDELMMVGFGDELNLRTIAIGGSTPPLQPTVSPLQPIIPPLKPIVPPLQPIVPPLVPPPTRLPPMPTFVAKLPDDERRRFHAIILNRNLTRAEKQHKIDELIARQTSDVQSAYQRFKQQLKINELKKTTESPMTSIAPQLTTPPPNVPFISNLSMEAQFADAKLYAIYIDETMSWATKKAHMDEIFANLSISARDELKSVGPRGIDGRRRGATRFGGVNGGIGELFRIGQPPLLPPPVPRLPPLPSDVMPPMPAFIAMMDEPSRQQLFAIVSNRSLSKAQKDARIEELVANESNDVKLVYGMFKVEMKARRSDFEAKRRELIGNLSTAARVVEQQLFDIFVNDSLTDSEKRRRTFELFIDVPESIKKELRQALPTGIPCPPYVVGFGPFDNLRSMRFVIPPEPTVSLTHTTSARPTASTPIDQSTEIVATTQAKPTDDESSEVDTTESQVTTEQTEQPVVTTTPAVSYGPFEQYTTDAITVKTALEVADRTPSFQTPSLPFDEFALMPDLYFGPLHGFYRPGGLNGVGSYDKRYPNNIAEYKN